MADEAKVIDGRFKGIVIRLNSASISGGRKNVIHQFPNRDTNYIEDLGGKPRSYQLEIIVASTSSADYFAYRDSLLNALNSSTPGTLEHPLYGTIDNAVCIDFSLSENFSEFGVSIVSALFEISRNTGIPSQTNTALSQLVAGNAAVNAAVNSDIADRFAITSKFKDNFTAAVNKVAGMVTGFTDATSFIGDAASDINLITESIGQLSADINSLIIAPQDLADAIDNVFSTIDGVTGTTESTAETMADLFGFGDDDDDINTSTAGKTERAKNNEVLNGAMNCQALGYAYTNAAQSDFSTVDEIDTAANALEVQYQAIIVGGTSQAAKDAATDLRAVVQGFFGEKRLNASQVITVFTPTTSTRLLSYQYYGDSSNGEEIAALNNIGDVSFISDNVEILTA